MPPPFVMYTADEPTTTVRGGSGRKAAQGTAQRRSRRGKADPQVGDGRARAEAPGEPLRAEGHGHDAGSGLVPSNQQPQREAGLVSGGEFSADAVAAPARDLLDPAGAEPLPSREFGLALPLVSPDVPAGFSLHSRAQAGSMASQIDFVEALLRAGLLKESDWKGNLEDTVCAGLSRWVNDKLGAGKLRILGPLCLVAGNDLSNYFTDLDDSRWRDEMRARPNDPIAFFALQWGGPASIPLFVSERTKELEREFPGIGYGLLSLIGLTFRWTVNGMGFDWGFAEAQRSEGQMQAEWLNTELENWDESEFDDNGEIPETTRAMLLEHWEQILMDCDNTFLTTLTFNSYIPEEVYETPFDMQLLPAACRAVEGIEHDGFKNGRISGERKVHARNADLKRKRQYHYIISKVLALGQEVNRCTRTHLSADHLLLFRNRRVQMSRAVPVFLRWHPDDQMGRIYDDVIMASAGPWVQNLVWLNGFQIDSRGQQSEAAEMQTALLDMARPDLAPGFDFAEQGSLKSAIASLEQCITVIKLLDDVLWWLHTPPIEEQVQIRVRV